MCQQCKCKDATIEAQRKAIVKMTYELSEAVERDKLKAAMIAKLEALIARTEAA